MCHRQTTHAPLAPAPPGPYTYSNPSGVLLPAHLHITQQGGENLSINRRPPPPTKPTQPREREEENDESGVLLEDYRGVASGRHVESARHAPPVQIRERVLDSVRPALAAATLALARSRGGISSAPWGRLWKLRCGVCG